MRSNEKLNVSLLTPSPALDCDEGPGLCALLMTGLSLFMILLSLPVSLMFVVKVVQVKMFIEVSEYFPVQFLTSNCRTAN